MKFLKEFFGAIKFAIVTLLAFLLFLFKSLALAIIVASFAIIDLAMVIGLAASSVLFLKSILFRNFQMAVILLGIVIVCLIALFILQGIGFGALQFVGLVSKSSTTSQSVGGKHKTGESGVFKR